LIGRCEFRRVFPYTSSTIMFAFAFAALDAAAALEGRRSAGL